MKAPEKIFLYPYSTDGIYEVETKPLEGTVEYTRTDAFMERAEKYIRRVADGLDRDDDVETFINEFKNHMKGE